MEASELVRMSPQLMAVVAGLFVFASLFLIGAMLAVRAMRTGFFRKNR